MIKMSDANTKQLCTHEFTACSKYHYLVGLSYLNAEQKPSSLPWEPVAEQLKQA